MRKTTLIVAAMLLVIVARSQRLPDVSSIKLDKKEDFNATANDAAFQASSYLLTTPIEKNNADRDLAGAYLLKWMKGTPDFYFSLDEDAAELAERDNALFIVFMAAMTKYVLENKADSKDQNKIKLNAVKSIVAYAKDEKNRVKINGELKKAIEADVYYKINGINLQILSTTGRFIFYIRDRANHRSNEVTTPAFTINK